MKKLIPLLLLFPVITFAQHSLTVIITNDESKMPVQHVSVHIPALKMSNSTDSSGIITFSNLPSGTLLFEFSHVGYKEIEKVITLPLNVNDTLCIFMETSIRELEGITIISTRSNRSINHTPTRVEVISDEEIHEEGEMRPGDIKMLLSESTGIQTQQTSATSGNASIRIQGLDGRYTQILKDGFPIYSGAASGLGLLQTPPLDLRQVEIIKGSSSTLYGGGAIAGMINLISKIPTINRELNVHANITSAGGLDLNGFYGQRFKKVGVTLFVARNTNKPFDPAHISFTAIPKLERYTINPKVFLYFNDKTKMTIGLNGVFENRLGGDMDYIKGNADSTHSYFEKNKTRRLSSQFTFEHKLNDETNLSLKNSIGYFNREITSPGYLFNGTQYTTFTEADLMNKHEKSDWVAGLNVLSDQFKEKPGTIPTPGNYSQVTLGAFLQNTSNITKWLTLETGIRGDYVIDYGFALLPRLSALFTITPNLTSRLGGGFGYKAPSIFTEESEKLLYRNILPINKDENHLEKSYGTNWDISYKTSFDELTFSINQLFFYTYLKDPLTLETASNNFFKFMNTNGHIESKGAETNIKLGLNEINLYLGYTYIDAKITDRGTTAQSPLTPKHRLNAALVYEVEDKWKIGSELYYFSPQQLTDGSGGRGYWLSGLVVEKLFEQLSVYINFENFGDVRQSRFESIYSGTRTNPVFKDIYAPLDGFIVNGGIKIKL